MCRKMIAVGLILGLALMLQGTNARAADTGSIVVTVSLATETSVSLSASTWSIGPVTKGSTSGPQSFTAYVGNTATKVEIKGENPVGGWTLASSAGTDQFSVTVASPSLALSTSYQTLAASVAAYGNLAFNLTYHAPTGDTKGGGVDQSFSITVKASAP